MAIIPVTNPYSLKNAILTIDVDDFSAHVSQVEFSPSTSTSTWRSINSHVIRDQSTAEWSCTIGLIQDMKDTSLFRYLLENEGDKKAVVFTPEGAGGVTWAATLVISPSNIGGSADGNVASSSVTLAVDGKPVPTDPI